MAKEIRDKLYFTCLDIGRERFDDEGVCTATSVAQEKIELNVASVYEEKKEEIPDLKRSLHIDYLLNTLSNLPLAYESMDASRTWIVYWSLHALSLLNYELDNQDKAAVINFLKKCQHPEGGFGGGPGQYPHLAPTYAAVNAIFILESDAGFDMIDRKGMVNFLRRMKVGDGSFHMHDGGEIDMRSVYCSLVVASLLEIDYSDIFEKSVDWITRCQSYEGGFSGTPGMEAHGGYTFCAICSLHLLRSVNRCDLKSLNRWVHNRQVPFEGGFQGRTNKLVDACYSFWQCGSLAIFNMDIINGKNIDTEPNYWHFDNSILQEYLLICCQNTCGGFKDKPTTARDPYHTCYALSGLSLAQSSRKGEADIVGNSENRLQPLHPVYNLPMNVYKRAKTHFNCVNNF